MAVFWGMGLMIRPSYLFILSMVTLFPTGLAQLCSFWDGECVDPIAQTAISMEFPPLFLDDINVYYGFDASSQGKGHEPMTKVSFWLGYAARHIDNSVIDMNRTSEVALRVGNLTGTPYGGNNGCDGVWGPQCSVTLKDAFKSAIYKLSSKGDYYSNPLDTVLSQMLIDRPGLPNCPPSLFDVAQIPVQRTFLRHFLNTKLNPPPPILIFIFADRFKEFAQETDTDQSATIQTSGNAGNPWKTWFIDNMSGTQQADQVAVAIISRGPSYNSLALESQDEVQIELACIQAPSSGSSSTTDT
ncbi:hypothetical protein FE257_008880 [Aspergillus nanangensis]|uniref:Uncharacterized protein n=1 Tax=Aspergillus nanangensis TaxID=2582783 RepID=A0AAD4GXK4_ASPNN|nr:hypothetical protein FE257_008880 [Aspergillus nanangensis]